MFIENKISDCFVQALRGECFREEGVEVLAPAVYDRQILSAIVGGGRRVLFLGHDEAKKNGMDIACVVEETTMDSRQQ